MTEEKIFLVKDKADEKGNLIINNIPNVVELTKEEIEVLKAGLIYYKETDEEKKFRDIAHNLLKKLSRFECSNSE